MSDLITVFCLDKKLVSSVIFGHSHVLESLALSLKYSHKHLMVYFEGVVAN